MPEVRGAGILDEIDETGPNPGNLRMFRYSPPDMRANAALVVVLHGCTQRAAAYADGAGWVELADRFGFCLLMPEQRRTNNPNLCFNWFLPGDTTRGAGEVTSIREMISRTVADCRIDPSRVFITGLSAGGAMTSAMLATYPEVFAGGAVIAGLPYQSATDIPGAFKVMSEARTLPSRDWAALVRQASQHKGPWPKVSIWHGADDRTVDPINAAEIAKQWTELHGTGQKPDLVEPHDLYTRRAWSAADGKPVVEEYIVPGLGHGTPLDTGSGDDQFGAAAPFLLEAGLSSSLRIAQFWGIATVPEQTSAPAPAPSRVQSTGVSTDVATLARPTTATRERVERKVETPERFDVGAIINRALRNAGLLK
ncbi:extracellular catalytic domain type 1 short-chain-length polyhydroxyalkanoate depolymerase [Microvirga antarctica]|uniref:extracellular catalytic domain type 1 short-chain-length polyhydroxyalkanoate depolymerase n=1 Tax=Microvirga antarctica TaxID=2819233 RepID=UPI001B317998